MQDVHDVVHFERHRGIGYPALQKRIEYLHQRYGGPTVIEDNAMGAAVRQNLDIRPSEVVPFVTTGKSKPRIISGLEIAFENGTITYDAEEWPELDRELRSYVRDDKAVAQDTAMALALGEEHAALAQRGIKRRGRPVGVFSFPTGHRIRPEPSGSDLMDSWLRQAAQSE